MNKNKKELTINKDNYKGYVELYLGYLYGTSTKEIIAYSVLVPLLSMIIMISLLLLFPSAATYIFMVGGVAMVYIYPAILRNYNDKNIYKSIHNRYSYIEKFNYHELKEALIKSKLLEKENDYYTLNIENYEKLSKCEDVINDKLENTITKYPSFTCDSYIPENQRIKVKVKSKIKKL